MKTFDEPSRVVAGLPALPTVGRYLVASRSRLPRLTHAVRVGETVRSALQSKSGSVRVFSGKTPLGEPGRGHVHASYYCEADPAGRLRYVTIHAPMGFDRAACSALAELVEVRIRRDATFRVVLTGVGRRRDFAGLAVEAGLCPLFATSRVWLSQTPFVPTRHPKLTRTGRPRLDDRGLQIGSAEHDLRRLLAARDLEPVAVAPLAAARVGGRAVPWRAFRTVRARGRGRRSTAAGFGFRLEFAEPVRGPIAVGYGSHFGLGTFLPGELQPFGRDGV